MKEELSDTDIVTALISQIKKDLAGENKKAIFDLGEKEFTAMIRLMMTAELIN